VSYAIATATAATRAVIEPLIETAWEALGYTDDTIAWPNATFTKPGNGPWIRVAFPRKSTVPFAWGGGTVLNNAIGVLSIQIFTPKNIGSELLTAAADKFRATFERQSFAAGIRFSEALGPDEIPDDRWAAALLEFPFQYEDKGHPRSLGHLAK
jgi:hypothetical protein